MTKQRLPYLLSIAFHLIIALIFFLIKIGLEPLEDEYVTIGFGAIGKLSSSGVLAKNPTEEIQKKQPEVQEEVEEKVVEKVELPKIENTDKINNVVAAEKKEENKEDTKPEKVEPLLKKKKKQGKEKRKLAMVRVTLVLKLILAAKECEKFIAIHYLHILKEFQKKLM